MEIRHLWLGGRIMNLFKKSILVFLSTFAILLAGCNKGGDNQPQTYITISPDTVEMYEEEYGLVTVETNSKKQITFVSENSDVVSVSSSGILLAKAAGTTVVKAMVEDIFASCSVTVKPISEKVEDCIRFEKSLFVIGLNDEISENAIVPTYYHGEQAISGKTFEYATSSSSIASVSTNGRITANGAGTTSITVTCDGVSATVIVDVYNIIIRTTVDWENMLKTRENQNARFYLDNDLDFTGVEYVAYAVEGNRIMGELEGNYHTVSNITMKANDSYQSIFGYSSVFALSNIRFINVTFTSSVRNCGLFTHVLNFYKNASDETIVGNPVISNVLCDFAFSDVISSVISNSFYGASVDNVYAKVRSTSGEPLQEGNANLLSYLYYTWYGTSHFNNVIGLVENGSITSKLKKNHEDYYPNGISEVKTDVGSSLIEANYLASLSFDSNIWNIKPNELPSFLN